MLVFLSKSVLIDLKLLPVNGCKRLGQAYLPPDGIIDPQDFGPGKIKIKVREISKDSTAEFIVQQSFRQIAVL